MKFGLLLRGSNEKKVIFEVFMFTCNRFAIYQLDVLVVFRLCRQQLSNHKHLFISHRINNKKKECLFVHYVINSLPVNYAYKLIQTYTLNRARLLAANLWKSFYLLIALL